jgi:hypothetical protein
MREHGWPPRLTAEVVTRALRSLGIAVFATQRPRRQEPLDADSGVIN